MSIVEYTSIEFIFFRSLVMPLQEQDRYEESYELYKLYGENLEESFQCLTKGKLFLKAIYELKMLQQIQSTEVDLLESLIKPELLSYQTLLISTITADEELFVSHKERLAQVRINRAKRLQFDCEAGDQADIDECDLLSDTTSLHSSRYTASSRGTG